MKLFTKLLAVALLAFSAGTVSAQSTVWTVDPAHSTLGFSVKHMVITTVDGLFDNWSLSLKSDKPDFSDAVIAVIVQTASIDTRQEQRDKHLKSDDFFNAEKYPTMTFTSTKLVKTGDGTYDLEGNLTIRDVTKPIVLKLVYNGTIQDPYGSTRAGFDVNGSINRFDYHIKWDMALGTGGLIVAKDVKIIGHIEVVKAK